jgi:hypothetical protein
MLSRAYRAAEFPAVNMVANPHSTARMYAATVSYVDGIRLLQPDTVAQTDRTRMHGVLPGLLPATKNLFNHVAEATSADESFATAAKGLGARGRRPSTDAGRGQGVAPEGHPVGMSPAACRRAGALVAASCTPG